MTTTVPADAGFLRAIAEHDPDRRCRRAAETAIAALEGGVGRVSAPLGGPAPSEHPDARRIAADVVATLLVDTGFPTGLDPLATLPVATAEDLLTALIEQLLAASRQDTSVLARAGQRLQDVHRGLSGDGTRPVGAYVPVPEVVPVARARRAWAGALLTLVDSGRLLALADEYLDDVEAAQRLATLRLLAAAAPLLAAAPQPAAPDASVPGAAELQALVQLALDPARPVRSRHRETAAFADETPAPAPQPTRDLPTPPMADEGAGREVRVPADWSDEATVAADGGAVQRSAYARLDAPDRVQPRTAFELKVGLAESPDAGVVSTGGLSVPRGTFALTVSVVAHGFDVLGGASTTRVVQVSDDDPFAYDVIRLAASAGPGLADVRTILAVYTIDGRLLGTAQRTIIVGTAALSAPGSEPGSGPIAGPGSVQPLLSPAVVAVRPAAANVDWVLPTDAAARPDLEIIVVPGNDTRGVERLFWHVQSRHPSIGTHSFEEQPLPDEVAAQMRQIYTLVDKRANQPNLGAFLRGAGRLIADAVPDAVWDALAAAAAAAGGPPTVLLATADAYVPWELAQVPRPWLPDAPAVLGAQAVLGRWPYGTHARSPAPPARLELSTMAVVSAQYTEGERLVEAEQEAAGLRARYQAHDVPARVAAVLGCLSGEPAAQLVHMAVHGRFDTVEIKDGIYLLDGSLHPLDVRGVPQSPVRFAFLNACQLGQGREVLGEYSGMAASLLDIGAGAVLAPLWKVDDVVARTVAEQFYPAVLERPGTPAAFLREQRCATAGQEHTPEGSRLAYVFFGHPLLQLTWSGADAASAPAPPP